MRTVRARSAALVAVACLLGASGCASSAASPVVAPQAEFDRPTPADEARASAGYRIDLEPVADCEQAFDLNLYRDRRIELIAWDNQSGCHSRAIDVRYLSKKLAEPQLFQMIQKLVRAIERQPKR